MATGLAFDSLETQEYDHRLYRPEALIEPISGLDAFGPAYIEQFRDIGFVSVADAYTTEEVQAAIDGLTTFMVGETPAGVELQFESAARGKVEELTPVERLDYVRKLMWFHRHDPRIYALANKPELLNVVREILGAEPEMFQDMALLKPPGIGREKPWHQDHAYFNLPEGTPVVGVWIALDEATVENGCMFFLPGGHHEGPIPHFNRRDWQICDADLLARKGQVAAPLPVGGALIFDGLVPHGTPTNRSNTRRRALQFHYVAQGTPRIPQEERMRIFGSEGRDVTC